MENKFFTFDKPISEAELISTAKDAIAERVMDAIVDTPAFTSPQVVRDYLIMEMTDNPIEVFYALFLNSKHKLLSIDALFHGTIDSAHVHPREVMRKVLEYNAAAVIFAHNHPSGNAEPSVSDVAITVRLKEALALIDVRVLDHLVVGGSEVVSFADRGML